MPRPAAAFILASGSPRRVELLRGSGYHFEVVPSNDPEDPRPDLAPPDLTLLHARNKAGAVAGRHPDRLVLGADTLVALEGVPLGKPADLREAAGMLARLSGRTHQVHTAVCLARREPAFELAFVETSHVRFRRLEPEDIDRYLSAVDVLDKAGAYAAQATHTPVVERVEGSFTNVVGLPMERVTEALAQLGIHPRA